MGQYNITEEEFNHKFEEFLQSFEGDISARIIVKAWNNLCKIHGWKDKIKQG